MPINKRPDPREVRLRYFENAPSAVKGRAFAIGDGEDGGFDILPPAPERPSEASRIAEAEKLVAGDVDGVNCRAGGSSNTKASFRDPHQGRGKGWSGNAGGKGR